MDIKVIKQEKPVIDAVPLEGKMPAEPQKFDAPQVELSKNIRKFDNRIPSRNPYSYNAVSLKKDTKLDLPASQMIVDPLYNRVAKTLGVDTIHEWNQYYKKVQHIVDWAKEESGFTDNGKIVDWIYAQLPKTIALAPKKIDDLFIYSKVHTMIPQKPKVVTKTVVKKVYVKQKMSTEDMINHIITGA